MLHWKLWGLFVIAAAKIPFEHDSWCPIDAWHQFLWWIRVFEHGEAAVGGLVPALHKPGRATGPRHRQHQQGKAQDISVDYHWHKTRGLVGWISIRGLRWEQRHEVQHTWRGWERDWRGRREYEYRRLQPAWLVRRTASHQGSWQIKVQKHHWRWVARGSME